MEKPKNLNAIRTIQYTLAAELESANLEWKRTVQAIKHPQIPNAIIVSDEYADRAFNNRLTKQEQEIEDQISELACEIVYGEHLAEQEILANRQLGVY